MNAVPDKREAIAALTSRTAYWDMIYPETNVHTLDIDAEQVRSSRRFLGNLSSRTEQRIIEDASHVSLTTERTSVVRDALESVLAKVQS